MKTPGARFPREHRLRNSAEFSYVFADPIRSADRYFTVLARTSGRPMARLGLAVSKRAAKRAVDRNRIKRIARDAFRHQPPQAGYDCVVIARPTARLATNSDLAASLGRHFERLKPRSGARING